MRSSRQCAASSELQVSVSRIDDFEDMVENAPCGYVTLQTNGRVVRVNRTLTNWTGHSAKEMVGNRFSDFLNMAGRIYFETHISPLLRMQGFFNEFALDMIAADGAVLQVIANALEGRDADGKAQFTRLTLIKATDRRRYERELLNAREEARVSLAGERENAELREQFIAVLGHDLRNPLASISARCADPGTGGQERKGASDRRHATNNRDADGRPDRRRAGFCPRSARRRHHTRT